MKTCEPLAKNKWTGRP